MLISVAASMLLAVARATTFRYNERSQLNKANLTAIGECINAKQSDLVVYVLMHPFKDLEAHTVYVEGTLDDDSPGNSVNEQERLIRIVRDCYREQGLHNSLCNSVSEARVREAEAAGELPITTVVKCHTDSALSTRSNGGPPDAKGRPIEYTDGMRFLLYQGSALVSRVISEYEKLVTLPLLYITASM